MHILLVEDNNVTAKSIELKLTAERHNVFTTDLGEDAIELHLDVMRNTPVDVHEQETGTGEHSPHLDQPWS